MKAKFGVPTLSYWWKARPPVALSRAAGGPCAVEVSLRGIGVRFRVDRLGYWDGEPD
jgi:hypothetical protein